MSRHWMIKANALVGLMMVGLTTGVSAKIPEPDNIVYGFSREDAVSVTLEVDGEQLAAYRMGDNPDAGGYYVLRVPIDSLEPQTPGTARPGDEARVYINGETEPAATLTIGQRGTIMVLHLARADADGDGVPDAVDNCPSLANLAQDNWDDDAEGDACDPDDDNDGMSDTYELANGLNPFNAADALLDSDLDGFINLAEFEDGTEAGDPRSNKRASRIRLYFRAIESAL